MYSGYSDMDRHMRDTQDESLYFFYLDADKATLEILAEPHIGIRDMLSIFNSGFLKCTDTENSSESIKILLGTQTICRL
jgi:hypothetical protein